MIRRIILVFKNVREKQAFRSGCTVGYRKAKADCKRVYEKGRVDALMDFLDSQTIAEEDSKALTELFK
jgi:hypothetical protein